MMNNAPHTISDLPTVVIGVVSVSDRASRGVYADQGIPALKEWLSRAIVNPLVFHEVLIADEQAEIERVLCHLSDKVQCAVVFTTGGTGPALRDVTPEATHAVAHKVLAGFGERMRQISAHYVPTAILSRQEAAVRGRSLIVNLPGQPKAIGQILGGVYAPDGTRLMDGVFAAIPYGVDLIGGVRIETDATVCVAFRPKPKTQVYGAS